MTEICVRCRKPIRYPIQRNVLEDGSLMHNDCLREYEEIMERFQDAINDAEKIYSLETTFNTNLLREDGKLNRIEDFSDEAFYRSIAQHMTKTNATIYEVSLELAFNDVPTGKRAGMIVRRRGQLYTYRYTGVFAYLRPAFRGFRYFQAILHYYLNPSFSSCVHQSMRELIWRSSPKWQPLHQAAFTSSHGHK